MSFPYIGAINLIPATGEFTYDTIAYSGQQPGGGLKEKVEFKQEEEVLDAFGNIIKVKQQQKLKMTNKEKKAAKKLRDARRARGEDVTDSEDDA